ncbi:MAG TPA: PIN domain-containing protein [Methylomirabilota bacterium]|nr:PIN domain-containing protein [Methylomirabilota bacterium]
MRADTNIIIEHLRWGGKQDSQLMKIAKEKPKEVLAISLLSVQELYEGRSTRDDQKEQYLLATISPLKILPYTYEIAQLAGEIARDLDQPIELADAAISATTILNAASLLTLNKKDFINIQNLELL